MLRGLQNLRSQARRIALAAVAGSMLVGCSPSGAPSSAPSAAPPAAGTAITAGLSEFKIELSATTAPAGPVSFALTNTGTTIHEFVVFQTDLAVDKLPMTADGTVVDEEGAGITLIDEVEDIAAGASASLDVTLPAAHYVLICNIPAHYTSGMRVDFTAS